MKDEKKAHIIYGFLIGLMVVLVVTVAIKGIVLL